MWPFKPRWIPQVGEIALVNTSQSDTYWRHEWASDGRLATIAAVSGKLIGFHWEDKNWDPPRKYVRWFERNHVRQVTVETSVRSKPQTPPLVDARVLEEVVALQKAVGSTDALIDLLKSVRATYEVGKESA